MADQCPECGTENPPGAPTCEFCNATLGRPAIGGPTPDPAAARRREEADRRLKARRRKDRIATAVLALVAVALAALLIAFFPKGRVREAAPDLILSYPTVAVDRYYSAIQAADYGAAQALLASSVRQSVTAEALAQVYAARPVSSHAIQDTGQVDDKNAYGAVSLGGSPTFVWMVREEAGWRLYWATELGDALGLPCPV